MSTDRVVPPLNFAMVAPGVYRSGYPNKKNYPFLKKLGLKTVMFLCPEEYSEENVAFLESEGIQIFHYPISVNKEPFGEIDQKDIADALVQVLDVRNHPILLHCNKGKHRIGCLVGCLRKLQNWSMTSIFDEYRRFAGPSIRIADQEFIEVFSEPLYYNPKHIPSWL
ncbi:protein-tyrosine phosphatase [Polychytrium aggregatum]|uniref:protein-tyrosine phosphatase n=1 Tax=Polychytrium aggregatum TaxID=110093 RepID=UPI0022FE2682|nr:protein-tyrosine phosphatase [Polychytrium aggregatum]KAI9209278.1 protein-tyrosine phosphatase [Polychytrium aggregatum]